MFVYLGKGMGETQQPSRAIAITRQKCACECIETWAEWNCEQRKTYKNGILQVAAQVETGHYCYIWGFWKIWKLLALNATLQNSHWIRRRWFSARVKTKRRRMLMCWISQKIPGFVPINLAQDQHWRGNECRTAHVCKDALLPPLHVISGNSWVAPICKR